MKKLNLWMLGVILLTAFMVSCTDNNDNPVPQPDPTVDPLTDSYIYDSDMDRTVKPGDSFYHFAVGGWLNSHTEYEQSWQVAGMNYTNQTALEAIAKSQDPQIQHLISNLHKKGNAIDEINTMYNLVHSAMYDEQTGSYKVLKGWAELSRKGYVTPITRSITAGENKIYISVSTGVVELEKQLREQGMENQLNGIIASCLGIFLSEDELNDGVAIVRDLADRAWETENPQLTGNLMQRMQGDKLPQLDLSVAKKGRRVGPQDFSVEALTEAFGLVDGRDKFDEKGLKFFNELAQENPYNLYLYTAYMIALDNYYLMPGYRGLDPQNAQHFEAMFSATQSAATILFNRAEAEALAEICDKEKCLAFMERMRTKMADRIENLEWMTNATKSEALNKLKMMKFYAGVPEQIIGEGAFNLTGESLLEDIIQVREQAEAVKERYLGMDAYGHLPEFVQMEFTLSTHNAFYAADFNSLYILPSFCSKLLYPDSDDAEDMLKRYVISYVFGHELCHGFDSKGSQYDATGHKRNWWADADLQKFKAMQQIMIDRFNELDAYPGQKADGKKTLGENMADLGGLRLSFELFNDEMKEKGLEGEQLRHMQREFFLNYTQVWKEEERSLEAKRALYLSDVHSCSENRINGQVRLMDEWYSLFNVTDGAIFVEPVGRPHIW